MSIDQVPVREQDGTHRGAVGHLVLPKPRARRTGLRSSGELEISRARMAGSKSSCSEADGGLSRRGGGHANTNNERVVADPDALNALLAQVECKTQWTSVSLLLQLRAATWGAAERVQISASSSSPCTSPSAPDANRQT